MASSQAVKEIKEKAMEKIWIKHYQPGTPAEINPDAFRSIVDLFNQSCDKYRQSIAIENFGTSVTYDELDQAASAFAAYCQQVLHCQKGDRIAIMMPNCIQYFIAMFGAMRAGLIVVNVNPLYTPTELIHQINDAGVKILIVMDQFAHTVEQALPSLSVSHYIVTNLGDCFPFIKRHIFKFVLKHVKKLIKPWHLPNATSFRQVLRLGKHHPFQEVDIQGEDIAYLQYTGGTTGVAKGAVLTHRNMIANVEQGNAWIQHRLLENKEVIITALPLYHIFSLTANCLVFIRCGARNVLITNPRDIPQFIKTLASVPFTAITGVNTLFNALLHNPNFKNIDFSHLKVALGGGMAVQRSTAERWQEVTGCPLIQAYGLTEASPAVTMNDFEIKSFNDSIGLPLPSTDVSIRDENGQECKIGEIGELCVHGPQVMREYWQKPEETAHVFYPGHWLRTGDIARIDEQGLVYIVDRLKDMIVVSGFNVYPNEVESVIASHPGVLEVGVVGMSHPESGEVVTAHIVKKDPTLEKAEIMGLCREKLTAYKVPKRIYFYDELPKTSVGKISRRTLRDSMQPH